MVCLGVSMAASFAHAASDYPIQPVPFTNVHFDDAFWGPRLETNRTVTLPANFQKCEETGRISNFAKAGGLMEGKHEGIFFNDSDVFKIVEGAAYTIALKDDPDLNAYVDHLIELFAAAQEDDGYLYTARTIDPDHPAPGIGPERWAVIRHAHELYNVGHMYEAAVAHYLATGKRNFLDVAIKNADLVASVFGPDGRHDPPGHEEIEIGLAKLYRVTGDAKYLNLAKFFIDQRGNAQGHELYGIYQQDHLPVLEQKEAVGHAVRAGYLYSGMADVAALTGDQAYIDAINTIWENAVSAKLYITGGIGARRDGEAFGDNFELPNKTAYNETCAAIANCLWNHRLFLLNGDAKYMDVFERTLYNGFLAGVSLEGDTYFYPNPLEADGVTPFNQGTVGRSPWFDCSCCPSNVVRFIPSLPGYMYAVRGDEVFVNLYAASKAKLEVGGAPMELRQTTGYPWDGAIRIEVALDHPEERTLHLRIPGWAQGKPVPGVLYRYLDESTVAPVVKLNGEAVPLDLTKGYLPIRRAWQTGDVIEVVFDMPVRRVICDNRVADNRGKVALERGPVVYCAEGIDNGGEVQNIILSDTDPLQAAPRPDLLNGPVVIAGTVAALQRTEDGAASVNQPFLAIPYYAWAHRGAGKMSVWLARTADAARVAPVPTLTSRAQTSASHTFSGDTLAALNDQLEPANSNDQSIPRFTWWDHRGKTEWAQYEFPEAVEVSSVEVYWFDDTGQGACRVPAEWTLLYLDGERWRPANGRAAAGVARDTYNRLEFDPVTTKALRISAKLQDGYSGGILEWRVD
ncbi:MAG: glycoside hydrolase family 127 protein [Candidatus Hydrogenedentes bacterium]|nr:glycoside hydrolase family 127 protein [Candidatus Hydrogenedentota bacterium]